MVDFEPGADPQLPLPDGDIAPGTLVWGSDFNAACALLYRLWGLIDAPGEANTAPQWDGLFTGSPTIRLPGLDIPDLACLQAGLARARAERSSSHHLAYNDVRLFWRGAGAYELAARYTVQDQKSAGAVTGWHETARVALVRADDGGLLISALDAQRGAALPAEPFRESYRENRGRATIVQFQAHMDSLSGRFGSIGELLAERLELHGLVASKRDASARGAALTDVNSLRTSVAGSDTVDDNVIRTHAAFADWFATAPELFRYGLHKLEHFAIKGLGDDRYETIAQFDWRAETLNGARIETHQPLTWIMAETGEKYMRIEQLLPFG